MVANSLEGLRIFFDRVQGWFETSITILDDVIGVVGQGSLIYDGDAC